MIQPRPGEIWRIDLEMRQKFRPMMVVSREDLQPERALSVCVPCTATIKGGLYEVALPRVRWMPGSDDGVANVLGIEAIEHHRFGRRAAGYEVQVLKAVRNRIARMLELEPSKAGFA